jgi:hypothetical protein
MNSCAFACKFSYNETLSSNKINLRQLQHGGPPRSIDCGAVRTVVVVDVRARATPAVRLQLNLI